MSFDLVLKGARLATKPEEVVDIGIAQQVLNKPGQVSRLLLGNAKGKRAPLESVT